MCTVLLPPPDLAVDRSAITRLMTALAMKVAPTRAGVWTLLDTPDHRLIQAGQLLVRRPGELAVLAAGRPAEALAVQPWTARSLPRLLAEWPAGPVRKRLAPVVDIRALLPLAAVPMQGVIASRQDDHGKTVARLAAWLATPTGTAPLLWVVVAALRGYRHEHRTLVAELVARGWRVSDVEPLTALRRSVADDAVEDGLAGFTDGTQPAGAALCAWLSEAVQRLPPLEAGVKDDIDTEFLHDLRVTLRKMRALTAQFKTVFTPAVGERIRTILGDWSRASNAVRDLDVWLLAKAEHAALVPASLRPGLDIFFAALAVERPAAQRRLAARLGSAVHRRERAALAKLLAAAPTGPDATVPLATLAALRTWKTFRQAARDAALVHAATASAEVHAVRIRCKKLRYLLDACGELTAPDDHQELRDRLKAVQAVLGTYNDVAVQSAGLLQRVSARGTPPAVLLAMGAMVGALDRTRAGLTQPLLNGLADLSASATRTRYRRLFRPATEA